MDIFAHGLWSFAIFHKRKDRWLAVLFGLLPDLLAFGPHLIYSLLFGSAAFGKPALLAIPSYVFTVYNVTHSLVIFAFVLILLFIITKKVYLPLFAWALHIFVDIPSHTDAFFPTPFLWPISSFHINGVSWGNPYFMIVNYSALTAVFTYIFFCKRKK